MSILILDSWSAIITWLTRRFPSNLVGKLASASADMRSFVGTLVCLRLAKLDLLLIIATEFLRFAAYCFHDGESGGGGGGTPS